MAIREDKNMAAKKINRIFFIKEAPFVKGNCCSKFSDEKIWRKVPFRG